MHWFQLEEVFLTFLVKASLVVMNSISFRLSGKLTHLWFWNTLFSGWQSPPPRTFNISSLSLLITRILLKKPADIFEGVQGAAGREGSQISFARENLGCFYLLSSVLSPRIGTATAVCLFENCFVVFKICPCGTFEFQALLTIRSRTNLKTCPSSRSHKSWGSRCVTNSS